MEADQTRRRLLTRAEDSIYISAIFRAEIGFWSAALPP